MSPRDPKHADTADPANSRRLNVKEVVWLFTLVICILLVYFSPIGEQLKRVREVHQALEEAGPIAELVFVLGATLVTSLGFPRMLIYPIGGLAFGFLPGLFWSVTALLFGGYLPFCYARWGGRAMIVRRWPKMDRLADYFHDRSYRTVVLMRVLPMPGFLTNALLGITRIRHRSFLLGTALGSIPPGIPAALLGSSMIEDDPTIRAASVICSVVLFAILWFVIPFALRKHPNLKLLKSALQGDNGA